MKRAIRRHHLLSCRIQNIHRKLCWVQGEAEPTLVRSQRGSIFESESGTMRKAIDLTQSAGLQTSIIVMDDGIKVILDAHHAVMDGNAMVKMLTDWLHLYHCEVTDTAPKLRVVDPERLRMRDRFPERPSIAPLSLKDAIRNFVATIRGRSARWAALVPRPRMTNESIGSHCVEVILSVEQGDQLRERLSAWNVKLNDLVLACCMKTFARLAPPGAMTFQKKP